MLTLIVQATATPTPNWPSVFSAKFEETFSGSATPGIEGYYALDMSFKDPATGIVGAQLIRRGNGTQDGICSTLIKNDECTDLAVGGQRYIYGGGKCCRCCSWEHGCGPIKSSWVDNATYAGQRVVKGQTCDSFKIQGFESNHLLQLAADPKVLCELDNADVDFLTFDTDTFTTKPPPWSLFAKPSAACDTYCGPVSDCKFG